MVRHITLTLAILFNAGVIYENNKLMWSFEIKYIRIHPNCGRWVTFEVFHQPVILSSATTTMHFLPTPKQSLIRNICTFLHCGSLAPPPSPTYLLLSHASPIIAQSHVRILCNCTIRVWGETGAGSKATVSVVSYTLIETVHSQTSD